MNGLTDIRFDPTKLKSAREKAGLGLSESARLLGISRQRLFVYENEHARGTPTPDVLAQLCQLYQVELSDLITSEPVAA
jgi:transcriptional regulator with XRE-family HTH domain